MTVRNSHLVFSFCLVLFTSCLGSGNGDFETPKAVAVDIANDRLFVFEANQNLYVRTASSNDNLPDQPALNSDDDDDDDLRANMPDLVTQAVAFADDDTSRLFLLGAHSDAEGTVLNQISVFDFDGESLSVADISPVMIDDGDDATDEGDDVFAKMILDSENGIVYIADTTSAQIFKVDAATGASVGSPITVASQPVDLSWLGSTLVVCHADSALSENITLVNTVDETIQTVALGYPCQRIAAIQTDHGDLLAVRSGSEQAVFLYQIDTTSLTLTEIPTEEEGFTDGVLLPGSGITSSVLALELALNADGTVSGYFAEEDGNVECVTIDADFSGFTHQKFSTTAINFTDGVVFTDDDGVAARVYFIAETGFLLSLQNEDNVLNGDLDH